MESTTESDEPAEIPAFEESMENVSYDTLAGVFIAIFLIAIVGNSIVIYVLFRKRRTWNITTTYLFNLALADAIFVCTLPLWAQTHINRMEWKFGLFMCKVVGVANSVNMYASIFFLTAMSVDRWIAIVHATTVNSARKSTVARFMCILVWSAAALFSIPRMIYQTEIKYSKNTPSWNDSAVTEVPMMNISEGGMPLPTTEAPDTIVMCTLFLPVTKHKETLMGLLEFIQAIVGFVIPMTVICVCYLRIVRTVRKKLISKRVRKERVAVLAALIVTAFFVCWLPMQLLTMYSAFVGWWNVLGDDSFNKDFYHAVYPFCVCLAYANSCVNPFVYAFTATNFKNNVKEVCGSNIGACKETRAYKMTLAREDNRSPLTPNKGFGTETKKAVTSSLHQQKSRTDKRVDVADMSSSDDIYEPFDPVNRRRRDEERPGAKGPPQCQHLAIEDTTSGVYYEYFSSPPVLQTGPMRVPKLTTRADIINHNNHDDDNKNHPESSPDRWAEPNIEAGGVACGN